MTLRRASTDPDVRDEAREALARGVRAPARRCSTPRATGGASWSRTPRSPPSTSSCSTLLGPRRRRPAAAPRQRAAGHPGRRRRRGPMVAPARPTSRRPSRPTTPCASAACRPTTRAWPARARWCTRLRRGRPGALLHQALARGAGPATPGTALPVLPPEMILLPDRARRCRPTASPAGPAGTFVALMVVLSRNPTFPQPVGLDELFTDPPGAGPMPGPKTPGPLDARSSRGR